MQSDGFDVSSEELEFLEPFLDDLKRLFMELQELTQGFSASGAEHQLNTACAFTYFRQMRDDASATLDHASSVIGSIAYSMGATREQLEGREYWLKRNSDFADHVDKLASDAALDPGDAQLVREHLGL